MRKCQHGADRTRRSHTRTHPSTLRPVRVKGGGGGRQASNAPRVPADVDLGPPTSPPRVALRIETPPHYLTIITLLTSILDLFPLRLFSTLLDAPLHPHSLIERPLRLTLRHPRITVAVAPPLLSAAVPPSLICALRPKEGAIHCKVLRFWAFFTPHFSPSHHHVRSRHTLPGR